MKQKLKTIKIKGKEYVEVNTKLIYFRNNYPGHTLTSEVVEKTTDSILILTTIRNEKGVAVATGLAEEIKGSTFINKTSYVENCETSSWGRALANLGIGIDGSVASAEEVQNAIANQDQILPVLKYDSEKYKKVAQRLQEQTTNINEIEKHYKLDKFTKLELQKLN
jgi:hypothetical protein|tara:strand:+ start:542 stop:1039 length:498 start_codon:yes stop_codon:yes gene_type:complete